MPITSNLKRKIIKWLFLDLKKKPIFVRACAKKENDVIINLSSNEYVFVLRKFPNC
jgi:hypothetical protein